MKTAIIIIAATLLACQVDEDLSGDPSVDEVENDDVELEEADIVPVPDLIIIDIPPEHRCADADCLAECQSYGWDTGDCFDPPQVGAPECDCRNSTCRDEDCRETCIEYGWEDGRCAPDPQPGRPDCDCFDN